jgi:hypothetical protein
MGDRFISAHLGNVQSGGSETFVSCKGFAVAYFGALTLCPNFLNREEHKEHTPGGRKGKSASDLVPLHFIIYAEKFPALQGNGHVSVLPEEIMKGA